MSIVKLSRPEWASTSTEKGLGMCTQPFTTVPPPPQMALRRFSLTTCPLSDAGPAPRSLASPAGAQLASRASSGCLRALRQAAQHQRGDEGHPHEPGGGADERQQKVEQGQNGRQETNQSQPPRQDAAPENHQRGR